MYLVPNNNNNTNVCEMQRLISLKDIKYTRYRERDVTITEQDTSTSYESSKIRVCIKRKDF